MAFLKQTETYERIPSTGVPLSQLGMAVRRLGYLPPGNDTAFRTYCTNGRSALPKVTTTGRWFVSETDIPKMISEMQLPTLKAMGYSQ